MEGKAEWEMVPISFRVPEPIKNLINKKATLNRHSPSDEARIVFEEGMKALYEKKAAA